MVGELKNVSVVIPCYNAEGHIESCIESIMRQSYPVGEVIIVDDGSIDDTRKIASNYPVKIVTHKENRGIAAARNTGVMNAENDFIAFLDVDCLVKPTWLEELMKYMGEENVAGVNGRLVEHYTESPPDLWRSTYMKQDWGEKTRKDVKFLRGCNNVYRKKALLDVGLFDEKYRKNHEDTDIGTRLKDKGHRLAYTPYAVARHLKRDSILSVLDTDWRYKHKESPSTLREVFESVSFNFTCFMGLLRSDISNKRFKLLLIDFVYPFHHTLFDVLEYIGFHRLDK